MYKIHIPKESIVRIVTYPGIEPNRYTVSIFGDIYDMKKFRYVRQEISRKDYWYVRIKSISCKRQQVFIHRLVAFEFIQNPYNKPTVNHIDGNRKNNKFNNLEWATYSENNLHSYRSNGRKSALAVPIYCIETGKIYKSSYDASKDTGIPQSSINRCANGIFKSTNGTHWGLLTNRKEIRYV